MAAQAHVVVAPERSHTQERISAVVLGLLGVCRLERQALVQVLGIAESGISRSINGKRKWTTDDLDAMASFFSGQLGRPIEPGIFFREAASLFDQNLKKMNGSGLRLVHDSTDDEGTHPGPGQLPIPFGPRLHVVHS